MEPSSTVVQYRRPHMEAALQIGQQSLTRYDTVSLRPISAGINEPPRFGQTATFPRISAQLSGSWSHLRPDQLPPFASDEQFHNTQGQNTVHSDSWHTRLHRNHHISIHRMAFLFMKFPAIAAGLIASLILFGRRGDGSSPWSGINEVEWRAGMAGMGTAGVFLASLLLLGQQNHWHSYRRANIQAHWRVFFSLLTIFFCIATGIFSAIALDQIRFGEVHTDLGPLNRRQRIIFFSALIAFSVLKLILASITVIHGIQAILRIGKDRKQMQLTIGPLMGHIPKDQLMSKMNGFNDVIEPIGAFDTHTDRY